MIFRVELRTDDPKLIEILLGVRNKAKFVKRALRHFISTKRGKETLMIMSKPGTGLGSRIKPARTNVRKKDATGTGEEKGKLKERLKRDESCPPPSEHIKDVYDLDQFL